MKKLLLSLFAVLALATGNAQNVGVGTSTPNASAALDVTATNKGLLPPRVALTSTTDATTIASPAAGLLVYNKLRQVPHQQMLLRDIITTPVCRGTVYLLQVLLPVICSTGMEVNGF